MKFRKTASALLAATVLLVSGCSTASAKNDDPEKNATTVTEDQAKKKRIREQAEKIVAGMTLEQKIAQMITISLRWWSDTPDDTDSFADATELNA